MSANVESELSARAGCTADLHEPAAGCAGDDAGPADALKPADTESAGCAADVEADAAPARPTPPTTLREFEHALRSLGFSARQAAAIARAGFKASEPDAADGIQQHELRAALERRAAALKGKS